MGRRVQVLMRQAQQIANKTRIRNSRLAPKDREFVRHLYRSDEVQPTRHFRQTHRPWRHGPRAAKRSGGKLASDMRGCCAAEIRWLSVPRPKLVFVAWARPQKQVYLVVGKT